MPWFIPAVAVSAYTLIARKLLTRYWHGVHGQHAGTDPPGLRTVARCQPTGPEPELLRAIAAELARDVTEPLEVTRDAVRTCRDDGDPRHVDIVRLGHRPGVTTVELTRAWTGVVLGAQTRQVLTRIHAALSRQAGEVRWFARQDRELVDGHELPFDDVAVAVR